MKDFFKTTLAVLLGVFIFSVISSLITFGVISIILMSSDSETKLSKNSIYELNLNGVLVERKSNEDLNKLLMGSLNDGLAEISLSDIRTTLKKAAKAEEIKALYLNCNFLSGSYSSVQELRSMVNKFKEESGKPVYAYADNYTQGTYWIASIADSVFLNPQGLVALNGVSMPTLFMKEGLDKLGVEMQVFKVGTFKSAVEPYILNEMSDPNRLQMEKITKGLWSEVSDDIISSRNITLENLDSFVNEGGMFQGAEAFLKNNLVDALKYRSDVNDMLEAKFGDDLKLVSLSDMVNVPSKEKFSMNKIAVLYATGGIDMEGQNNMSSEDIVKELNKLAEDDNVKAVVLRVNSPGGSAFGSDQMWHAAKNLKAKKPLIVSMSDYAASGGYYMSCIADEIIAEPTTLTGSIGIYGMFPNAQGLADKLGVHVSTVKTHELSDFGALHRPVTESEKAIMQNHINRGYETFVSRCAEGRKKTSDEIKAIAEGRVWLGKDALELGLVDKLGGLDEAVELALSKTNLTDNYSIEEYPAKKDLFTSLMESFEGNISARLLKSKFGNETYLYEQYKQIMGYQGIQALMLYRIGL